MAAAIRVLISRYRGQAGALESELDGRDDSKEVVIDARARHPDRVWQVVSQYRLEILVGTPAYTQYLLQRGQTGGIAKG